MSLGTAYYVYSIRLDLGSWWCSRRCTRLPAHAAELEFKKPANGRWCGLILDNFRSNCATIFDRLLGENPSSHPAAYNCVGPSAATETTGNPYQVDVEVQPFPPRYFSWLASKCWRQVRSSAWAEPLVKRDDLLQIAGRWETRGSAVGGPTPLLRPAAGRPRRSLLLSYEPERLQSDRGRRAMAGDRRNKQNRSGGGLAGCSAPAGSFFPRPFVERRAHSRPHSGEGAKSIHFSEACQSE